MLPMKMLDFWSLLALGVKYLDLLLRLCILGKTVSLCWFFWCFRIFMYILGTHYIVCKYIIELQLILWIFQLINILLCRYIVYLMEGEKKSPMISLDGQISHFFWTLLDLGRDIFGPVSVKYNNLPMNLQYMEEYIKQH